MWPADCRGRHEEIRRPADGAVNALSVLSGDARQWVGADDRDHYRRIARLRIGDSYLQIVFRHYGRAIVDGERLHRAAYLISTEFARLAGRDIAHNTRAVADYVAVDLRIERRRDSAGSIRVWEHMRVSDRQRLEQ